MDAVSLPEPSAGAVLRRWLQPYRRLFVLTGAGCSTGSGIPDYRGADGAWKQRPPVTYQAFVQDPATRARYWARSFVGWPRIAQARPNPAHHALAAWQRHGRLAQLVTQNVDGLHQRAGSQAVIDLHGRLDAVRCLDCGIHQPRTEVQAELARRNPDWLAKRAASAAPAPDGDAHLDGLDPRHAAIPTCPACGGDLKPDVVFFGENVPRERVGAAQAALRGADAMLVVGSSLMVYSGYRFARMAHEAGLPLAVLTRGVSRADALATLKLDADCGATLTEAMAA
ncbi:NAD-dependent protein deacetylase [Lysobacter koreensis]|uniref:NAD-dependent protein deacetylase n=1 Tax=Lysobacter koreensis TaxID=266122 RepID=A0ABW2YJ00_9GAMM